MTAFMRWIGLFGLFGIFTSGYSSHLAEARYSPVNRETKPANPEFGRIIFYRPSIFGPSIRPDILLNGEKVGEAIPQGFFYVDRPPGHYEVVTSTEVTRKVGFFLEKGRTRFVRFSTSIGFFAGHVYGELVAPEVGSSEVQECKYTGQETRA